MLRPKTYSKMSRGFSGLETRWEKIGSRMEKSTVINSERLSREKSECAPQRGKGVSGLTRSPMINIKPFRVVAAKKKRIKKKRRKRRKKKTHP